MTKSSIITISAIALLCISAGNISAEVDGEYGGSWCSINVKDISVDSSVFFTWALPGKSVNIGITPHTHVTNIEWEVEAGHLSGSEFEQIYKAPRSPGHYPITVTANRNGQRLEATIHVFVLVPFSHVENGYLQDFEIGNYPDPKEIDNTVRFEYPPGFIRVNERDARIYITENYKLGDFLPSGYSGKWPRYVLVDEKLALKLEILTSEFRSLGLLDSRMKFLSAFRPPARNRKAGQARYSQHQYGRAVDIYIDDGSNGRMDDLNHDGNIDLLDALVMYRVVDAMEKDGRLKGLEGGLGAYPGTGNHGPFIHMDVRIYSVRWINDENGKVEDVSEFLKQPENRVSVPPHGYRIRPTVRNYHPDQSDGSSTEGGYESEAYQAQYSQVGIERLKEDIKRLESEVLDLEERWGRVEAGPKPLNASDLYLAADVANDSMLLNRGRQIIKRMPIKEGASPRRCPDGLADIYRVPEGIVEVRGKSVAPVWFHPEWSFLGEKLASPVDKLRNSFYSKGVANIVLDLGAGMRIHPTSLPGKVVLPGCIGVPTADMQTLQSHTKIGTRVYLFEGGAYIPGVKLDSSEKKDLIALEAFLSIRKRAAELDKDYLLFDLKNNHGWIKRGEIIVRTLKVHVVGPSFSPGYSNARNQFRMPRGTMFVQRRMSNPPWYKPDSMFVRQKKTAPEPLGEGRIQKGLLGPCALYLGGGIVIHGRHSPLVPEYTIDYVAIELESTDLNWVWRTIPEGGVVILK